MTRWLGRWVREEREFSADDLAVLAIDGTPRDYARALAALESLRARDIRPHMVRVHGGPLLRRIRRLAEPATRTRPWGAAIVVALLCVLTVSVVRLSREAVFAAHAVMSHELGLPRDFERIAERGPLSSSRR